MGHIKHHAIVVTSWQNEHLEEARQKAIEIFEKNFENEPYEKPYAKKLISEITEGLTNGINSFFIAPDGSKEGWETSNNGNNARKEFLDWLQNEEDNYCDYVEISFGGDEHKTKIIRSKENDLESEDDY